jgi:hypothetical protein
MKLRALVAKADGVRTRDEFPFGPGSIKTSASAIPVIRDFDHRKPIGTATITVIGDDVFADIDARADDLVGKYPALGYRPGRIVDGSVIEAEIITVGICVSGNADPRIPPIT